MILKWQFLQYESENGRKAIDDWRKSLHIGQPRASLDLFLREMAKQDKWEYPDIDSLKGERYQGLTELRWKCGRVPHRLFGYEIADHSYLLLIGCTHDGKKYYPPDALETARSRRDKIVKMEATYCEYKIITNS